MTDTKNQNGAAELERYIRARVPVVWVESTEEFRVVAGIRDVAIRLDLSVVLWSATKGIHERATDSGSPSDPSEIFSRALRSKDRREIIIALDAHPYFGDPLLVRQARDAVTALQSGRCTIVFVSPKTDLPLEIRDAVPIIRWSRPDRDTIGRILDGVVKEIRGQVQDFEVREKERDEIISASLGLTAGQISDALAVSWIQYSALRADAVAARKAEIVRASGVLEFVKAPDLGMTEVGGLESLKTWLRERRDGFGQAAREYGLEPPRGVLLVGVPGTGKSLSAKAVSAAWQFPLLRLDLGRVFGGLVGESERNIREACALAETVAPCILWIDELEKAFSGVTGSGQSDAGTSARVFGAFLSWMQESAGKGVFIFATANDVSSLPPEMMRKGRFDEIFFLDLPNPQERAAILAIHLVKRGQKNLTDIAEAVTALDGYSGAEIEAAVVSALYKSFSDGQRALTCADVVKAACETQPLSVQQREKISALREWANARARSASARDKPTVAAGAGRQMF